MKTKKYIYGLATGHLFVDFNQGALAAFLPILIATHHFNYALAATLVFAMNLVSSIIQPLFGQLSDHQNTSKVIVWAILIASIGFCFLGWVPNYSLLIIGVLICGIGIAAYHPDAAKLVNGLAGDNKAEGMSIFSFGGNLGFALGPILLTMIVNWGGIHSITFLMIPAIAIALFLQFVVKYVQTNIQIETNYQGKKDSIKKSEQNDWKHFVILSFALFGRSIIFYGLNTFLALYWIKNLKQSNTAGSVALTILFVIGSIGTLIGGRLADRIGYVSIIKYSFICLPFLLVLLALTRNILLANLILIPLGLAIFMPYSSMVILGQKYLPKRMGLASGVTLGLAVSVGGIVSPILGIIADNSGLLVVIWILALIAIIPAIVSFLLVTPSKK